MHTTRMRSQTSSSNSEPGSCGFRSGRVPPYLASQLEELGYSIYWLQVAARYNASDNTFWLPLAGWAQSISEAPWKGPEEWMRKGNPASLCLSQHYPQLLAGSSMAQTFFFFSAGMTLCTMLRKIVGLKGFETFMRE